MAPSCQINGQWETKRRVLGTFSAKATNISLARSKFPFQRTVSPAQIELIESLRKNYAKNAAQHNPDKTIKVERYAITEFNLKSKNLITMPSFCHGLYTKNSGVVVDFANKQLGGGFLTYGLAQEEVMFLERLDIAFYTAMMYTKNEPFTIKDCEALSISGADKWATLEFYGRVPDDWNERSTFLKEPESCEAIIAIDCLKPEFIKYAKGDLQWVLKKAYVGFQSVPNKTISTGNWGCGAFFNNKNTMLCVQVLAATLAGKTLKYHANKVECAEGLALIQRWTSNNTPIKDAFFELIQECEANSAFVTSWDPKRRNTHGEFAEINFQSRKSRMSVNDNAISSPSTHPVARRRNTDYIAPPTDDSNPIARRKTIKKVGEIPVEACRDDVQSRHSTHNAQTRRQTVHEGAAKPSLLTQPRNSKPKPSGEIRRSKTLGEYEGGQKGGKKAMYQRQAAVNFNVQRQGSKSTSGSNLVGPPQYAISNDSRNSTRKKRGKRSGATGSTTSTQVRKKIQGQSSRGSKSVDGEEVSRGNRRSTDTRSMRSRGSVVPPAVLKKVLESDIGGYDSDQSFEVDGDGRASPSKSRVTVASRGSVAVNGGRKSFIRRLMSKGSNDGDVGSPSSFRKRMSSIFRPSTRKSQFDA